MAQYVEDKTSGALDELVKTEPTTKRIRRMNASSPGGRPRAASNRSRGSPTRRVSQLKPADAVPADADAGVGAAQAATTDGAAATASADQSQAGKAAGAGAGSASTEDAKAAKAAAAVRGPR